MKRKNIKYFGLFMLTATLPVVLYATIITGNRLNINNRPPYTDNTVNGTATAAIGYQNNIRERLNANGVDIMRASVAIGAYHDLDNAWQFAAGFGNTLGSKRQIALGLRLLGPNDSPGSVLVGKHNDVSEYTDPIVFSVGNGTSSSNKSNALTVYANGDIIINKVQGDIPMY